MELNELTVLVFKTLPKIHLIKQAPIWKQLISKNSAT